MRRVAVVATIDTLRDVLVCLADSDTVQLDQPATEGVSIGKATRLLQGLSAEQAATPLLARDAPDLDELARTGRIDLLAGEAALEDRVADAIRRGGVAALVGWCPARNIAGLAARLAGVGGAVVTLRKPPGVDPPTMLRADGELRRSCTPLVSTYGTVPYVDLDPTLPAAVAYVLMFGMMFGDAGHGLLLLTLAMLVRAGWPRQLARLRPVWPFLAGAGITSTVFGLLYGEFFGPTGLVPVLWLNPMEAPVRLMAAAIGVGSVLLAFAYAVGIVNRWREGGPRLALYSPSGIAGAALFLGLAGVAAGVYAHHVVYTALGVGVAVAGLGLVTARLAVESAGGAEGVAVVGIGVFDLLVRLGSNLLSFTRLAAFGLTHAALGSLFWRAAMALAGHGPFGMLGAALTLVAGTAVAFSLEALVAAVQALRLEYYELFSRVFEIEGQPFRPWHVLIESAAAEEKLP